MDFRGEQTQKVHWFTFVLAVFIIAASFLIFHSVRQTMAVTGSFTSCPSGFNIAVGGATSSGTTQIITGMTNVVFGASTSTTPGVEKVAILVNGIAIGNAMGTSGSYSWNMPWITSLTPNGQVYVQAEVAMVGGGVCRTNPITVQVQNPTQANLVIVAQPQSWAGPLSFSFPINATVYVPENSFNATQFVIFEYSATIGSIIGNGPTAQYSSGKTAGSGTVTVYATYGGKRVQVNIPVKVGEATAPLPAPTSTTNTTTTTTASTTNNTATATSNNTTATVTTTPTSTTTSPVASPSTSTTTATTSTLATNSTAVQQATVAARTATLANNTPVQDCAVTAVGKDRFAAINNGTARPTVEELKKLSICFATSNYILPSNFAPVAPKELPKLANTDNLEVKKVINENISNTATKREALKFSGVAKPNSTVVLYIFSEPLVLTTTADADGNWSYALQDPIETGKHEIYAVVDRGDGVYQKSSPLDFVIGTAEAAADNPAGLSLTLADTVTPAQSNRSTLFYIAGSVLLVLVVSLIALLVLLKIRKKPPTPPTGSSDIPIPPTPPASTPTIFTPTQG